MILNNEQQKSLNAFYSKRKENPYGRTLALMVGGSTLYGLNTAESDLDLRGVYMVEDVDKILGLPLYGKRSFDNYVIADEEVDAALYDLRKYIHLLKKTNSQVVELLYADPSDYIYIGREFGELRKNREKLLDMDKMFNSLRGFIQGERRLMNGERTGQLGGKRKAALEKYGYSYKNLVQILRLAECGCCLLQEGYFPVNLKNHSLNGFRDTLMDIKTRPQQFTLAQAETMVDVAEAKLEVSYNTRNFNFEFDEKFANEFIADIYGGYIGNLYGKSDIHDYTAF